MRPSIVLAVIAESVEVDSVKRRTIMRERAVALQMEIRPLPPEGLLFTSPNLLFHVEVQGGQLDRNYTITLRMRAPSGFERISPVSHTVRFDEASSCPHVSFPLDLLVPNSGVHWYGVHIDGKLMTDVPFRATSARRATSPSNGL